MTDTKKNVVLLSFIERLRAHGSWCGETHIQKGTYLLQELTGVPLGFNFVLYKHGPYSFDEKDELTALVADSLLTVKPRAPYGATILPGENSSALLERFPITRKKYQAQMEFVASHLGSKGVTDLERLATALYVSRKELPGASADARAARITELKPHVPLDKAHEAVAEIDSLIEQAKAHALAPE